MMGITSARVELQLLGAEDIYTARQGTETECRAQRPLRPPELCKYARPMQWLGRMITQSPGVSTIGMVQVTDADRDSVHDRLRRNCRLPVRLSVHAIANLGLFYAQDAKLRRTFFFFFASRNSFQSNLSLR